LHRITKVAVVSHGCKLNQFEGESLGYSLERRGFRIVGIHDSPDCVVVNTCTVTNRGDRKSRNTIMRASRVLGEEGLLVVTGCYAQTNPDELRELGGVGLVVGQEYKSSIPGMLEKLFRGTSSDTVPERGPFGFIQPLESRRSRIFVKVQDGCDRACAYCKVPLARGSSKSRDYRDIARTLKEVHEGGYREVVLTGVNLGSYHSESLRLPGLLRYLLAETPSNLRLRLSSIEPDCFSESLFDVITDRRIMPHFHVPLQSGSDRVLRLMSRLYGAAEYLEIMDHIRILRGESHLATDVIVGFPGENEDDFRKTVDVVREVGFASLHVFRYSPRQGTAASDMEDGVSQCVKTQRSASLIALGRSLQYRFRKNFEGTVRPAVLEPRGKGYTGITDNYIRVELGESGPGLARACLPVHIHRVTADRTEGRLVDPLS
jgi:threonylcarbamoyladenosine tRNA methylthiotransferase MtaB